MAQLSCGGGQIHESTSYSPVDHCPAPPIRGGRPLLTMVRALGGAPGAAREAYVQNELSGADVQLLFLGSVDRWARAHGGQEPRSRGNTARRAMSGGFLRGTQGVEERPRPGSPGIWIVHPPPPWPSIVRSLFTPRAHGDKRPASVPAVGTVSANGSGRGSGWTEHHQDSHAGPSGG